MLETRGRALTLALLCGLLASLTGCRAARWIPDVLATPFEDFSTWPSITLLIELTSVLGAADRSLARCLKASSSESLRGPVWFCLASWARAFCTSSQPEREAPPPTSSASSAMSIDFLRIFMNECPSLRAIRRERRIRVLRATVY